MLVNKNKLVGKMDLEVVGFDYVAQMNENVFLGFIGGSIPVMLKSKTITKDEFDKMCA